MPIADAQIVKKEPSVIPFEDAADDHILSMVNILSDQWDSINGLKDSINKSVVPLLASIERNTRLLDPVKSIRKKIRASKIAGASAADGYKAPVPRTTNTLKSAPWGRPGVDSSVQVTPDKAVPISPAQKAETLKREQTDIVGGKDTDNFSESLVSKRVEDFKKQESLKTKEANREKQSTTEKKTDIKEVGSKDAANEVKLKKERKQEQTGFADKFKDVVSGWDGNVLSQGGGKSDDLKDVVGSASGGVFWASIKELSDAAGSLNESNADDKSVTGMIKKALMDKTGITTVKEKASSVKEKTIEKIKGFASKGEKAAPLSKGYKKDKNGKLRNGKGHFVTGPEKTLLNKNDDSGDDQAEALGDISDTLKATDKEAKKRHDELVGAVAAAGAGAGGGGASGFFGDTGQDFFSNSNGSRDKKKKDKRKNQKKKYIKKGGKGSRLAKLLSKGGGKLGKLGKLGGIATAVLGGGMGMGGMLPSMLGGLGGLFGNDTEDASPSQNIKRNVTEAATNKATDSVSNRIEKKAASRVEKKAASKVAKTAVQKTATKSTSKVAGLASKMGGKGMLKALSGASKMLKVLGPVAAIATAGVDAYQGYNDKEMQSKAFGLKEGEEATGGQKTASAVANVLDMGGLVSGGLGMLGADIETADIAKGIYEFFGGKNDKEEIANEATATIQKKDKPNPESIQKLRETADAGRAIEPNSTQPSIDKLAKQVEKLALSLDPKKSIMGSVKKGMKEIPQIMTEFDDSTLTLMAHDRI